MFRIVDCPKSSKPNIWFSFKCLLIVVPKIDALVYAQIGQKLPKICKNFYFLLSRLFLNTIDSIHHKVNTKSYQNSKNFQ